MELTFKTPGAARSASSNAFELGWVIVRLFFEFPRREADHADQLPTVNELGSESRVPLGLQQVDELVLQLGGSRGNLPVSSSARAAWDADGDSAAYQGAIEKMHIAILGGLLLADPHLCNAYMAGRTLCEMCWRTTSDTLRDTFTVGRIQHVRSWLQSSAGGFPALSVDAVGDSLWNWYEFIRSPWRKEPPLESLRAQGETWRGLLAGDLAIDTLLTPDRYVDAADISMRRSTRLLRTVIVRMWPFFVVLAAVAAGLFSIAWTQFHGLARTWSALGAGVGWFGISGTTVRARLGQLVAGAEAPIWQLSKADAVAAAVTCLPRPHATVRHKSAPADSGVRAL